MERKDYFIQYLKVFLPKFNVKKKDESNFMKLIGKILFFNKNFMNKFATTIGYTTYLPAKEIESLDELSVIAHEYQHAVDYNKMKILFVLIYSFPQILFLLFLLFPFLGYWSLLSFLFLLPLPAYGRMKLELKGYIVSIFVYTLIFDELNLTDIKERQEKLVSHFNEMFTSSDYYYMWPFGVTKQLQEAVDKINSKEIYKDKIFFQIKCALKISYFYANLKNK